MATRVAPSQWSMSAQTARIEPISDSRIGAIFSPIPGTPGRLSLASPRSAAYSR